MTPARVSSTASCLAAAELSAVLFFHLRHGFAALCVPRSTTAGGDRNVEPEKPMDSILKQRNAVTFTFYQARPRLGHETGDA